MQLKFSGDILGQDILVLGKSDDTFLHDNQGTIDIFANDGRLGMVLLGALSAMKWAFLAHNTPIHHVILHVGAPVTRGSADLDLLQASLNNANFLCVNIVPVPTDIARASQ